MMNEWILSSSLLIAAVLALRFALRGRISLRLQYGLWLVVLVRLLLPVQLFTSDFGAGSIAQEVDISQPVRQVYVSANEDRYEREYSEAYRQVEAQYEALQQQFDQSYDPIVVEQEAQSIAQRSMELDLSKLLTDIWFAGMAVMTAVIVVCNVHLGLHLKRRRWEFPAADCLLRVYVTEAVPTPCIFGLFHPAIYLTPEAVRDEQVRSHVLTHELTHYRHGDHIWSVLRSVCLVLHWYNPLVWIAAKVSRADAELACDEGALEKLGESQRGDYGRTLIGLTCAAPIADLFVTATTMTGSAGSIRERIKLLMKRPRNTVLTVTAVILMVTLIVGCSFAGAPATTQTPETTEPTQNGHLNQTDLTYALPMERAMADYADKNPRALTAEEITQADDGLASVVYDEEKDEYSVAAVAAFFTSCYDDVRELDFAEFLRYFPASGVASEEEFQLLRQKYGADFVWAEHESLQDMPVPVHRYAFSDIDAVIRRYANIPFQELQDKESVYYLEETDSYYNFTSDFGPGMFSCVDGFVYDGGAILYSTNKALFLTEAAGHYSITAHLPVIDKHGERSVTEGDSFTQDGLLVYPGTRWGMTEAELIDALNIQEYGVFSGMRGIHLPKTTFCGYPVGIGFYFGQHTKDTEWGLFGVMVKFEQEADFEAVRAMLTEQLGAPDARNSEAFDELWRSDVRVEELVSPEAFEQYREARKVSLTESYLHADDSASTVSCDSAKNTIYFEGWVTSALQIEAAIPRDQTEEVRALFSDGGNPYYRSALTELYAGPESFDAASFFSAGQSAVTLSEEEKALVTEVYGKEALEHTVFRMTWPLMDRTLQNYIGTDTSFLDMSAFLYCPDTEAYLLVRREVPELRSPEILSLELPEENQAHMIYRFYGEEQTYCAMLLKGENWKVYSNQLLISAPLGARTLNEKEVEQVRTSFAPSIYNAATGANDGNPLACFTHSMYADVSEMTKFDFLCYFPATAEGTKEELALLIEKYPDYFADWTTETMPLPVHRYDADALDDFMMEFAGIPFRDLPDGRWAHYLEETDSYYNYTSDFGLMGFPCTGGWVYDGGAMLCTALQPGSVLILSEHDGDYRIRAHLPAIVTGPPSSHTMIPAELPDEKAIAATAEAFVTAYEENINLNRDNSYDHLTVLTADPAQTVGYQGKTVPLSKLQENIEYLHGKEAYWKHVGKDAGILPDTFRLTVGTEDLRIDGDTATVTVYDNMTFYYEGNGAPSGMGEAYDLTLVRIDGTWLIADVIQRNDWFDADYKDDPDFDPEALIAAHIP